MSIVIFHKLLAIMVTVGLGYIAGRQRWLARPQDADPARVLGNVAFYIFVPALLFRTMARLDLAHMPWRTIAAFFVPVIALLLLVYFTQRGAKARYGPAAPSVRAITAVFGNSVQVGIPFVTALFGEGGLAVLLALISLHALVLLSVLTVLVELDLARASAPDDGARSVWQTLAQTARNTLVHPVVLPVIAGLAWNLTGLQLHPAVDEALSTAAAGVVPTCLVLLGVTLASYGLQGGVRRAATLSFVKLVLLPAVVLGVAYGVFGLSGTPLAVVVIMAAMPTGANAMIFAQRYETLQAEVTTTSVLSTVAFALTAPLWIALLARL